MDQSKVSTRYAKAFFSLAKEKEQLDILKKDIELIDSICRESDEFKLLLESPVIGTSLKLRLMETIFKGKVNETTLGFIHLVTKNKREAHLPGICRNILTMYQGDRKVKTAVLTSAVSLGQKTQDHIKSLLEDTFQTSVDLNEKVDPELIGGFILRVDDRQVDASVATRLRKVEEKLLQSEIK